MKITMRNIRKIIKEEIDLGSTLVKIDSSLKRCIKMKDLIYEFCNYTCDELGIDRDLIDISIVDNRDQSGIRTTAFYNPQNHKIAVYGKDRAVVDICRSIAHELTHMQQMIENRIDFPVQDVGGKIEDEANARAGEIIKSFAQSKDDRKRIYENAIRRR
tara:strand:- start:297 stop:773 length:477 start_codon:yes stop_codon:yes gene_type:complete